MGLCKRKNAECKCISENSVCNSDNCHRKLPDIGFREELMLRADEYEKNIDIHEDVENIKKNLNECYYKRKYTISLIKVTKGSVAIGQCTPGRIGLFIPHNIEPLHYRQLFINEFNKLGFSEECMELSVEEHSCFDSYEIKLKW